MNAKFSKIYARFIKIYTNFIKILGKIRQDFM